MAILGASWPSTSPDIWDQASQAQRDKANQLVHNCEGLRDTAKQLVSQQSGETIDGMHDMLYRKAAKVSDQADSYFAMSRGSEEVARLLYGQREDLDKIDRDAHQKIEEIRSAARGLANQAAAATAVWEVVMQAIAQAKAVDAAAAGRITAQAVHMGLVPPEGVVGGSPPSNGEEPGLDLDPSQVGGFGGGGGRPGPGGMPQAPAGFGQKPDTPPHAGDEGHQGSSDPSNGQGGQGNDPNQQGDPQSAETANGAGSREHGRHAADHQTPDSSGLPAMPMPFGGGSSSGGGGSSPLSSAGGGLSSLKPPELGGMGGGMPQGLSSGAGLPGGAGMSPPPAIPPAASSPFSQGLNAGLAGAPATPLAPPVTSVPPTASAAPAGAVSSGPASVAAAAGSPVSSPAASPFAAPMAGGPAAGASSMGPLPPFGSDVRSAAAGGGGAVTPASGSAPATVSADRAGAPGGGLAVPPGVVGSATGAGAGAATEGVRASLPDPLLEMASQLLDRLLYDSRAYPLADWCVGVFRRASGVETVVVNSDGAGFIPLNVFVPQSALMLFADPGLPEEFRGRWFSWANPAETMVAFAQWAGEHVELYALAVSTDQGGSSAPARAAGVPHVAECNRALDATNPDSTIRPLDAAQMHRLETLDRGLYARLMGVGDGRRPDQSEAWRTTTAAAHLALSRAGALPDLSVPSVIREVLDLIGRGLKVPAESWQALHAAYMVAATTSAGLRPGWSGADEVASPHALAQHDLARLMELLLLWKFDSPGSRDIQYADIAYLAKQINDTPRNGAAV
jgi:hypothetical protein